MPRPAETDVSAMPRYFLIRALRVVDWSARGGGNTALAIVRDVEWIPAVLSLNIHEKKEDLWRGEEARRGGGRTLLSLLYLPLTSNTCVGMNTRD